MGSGGYEVLNSPEARASEVKHVSHECNDEWCTTPLQGLRQAMRRRRRTTQSSISGQKGSAASGDRISMYRATCTSQKLAAQMQILAEEVSQVRAQTTTLIHHFGLEKANHPGVFEWGPVDSINKYFAFKVGDHVRVVAKGPLSNKTAVVTS